MIWHPEAEITIRRLSGLSVRSLATQAAVAPSYLSRLETDGERSPSIEIIGSLARALDVPPEALYVEPSVEVLMDELERRIDGDVPAIDAAMAFLNRLRQGRRS